MSLIKALLIFCLTSAVVVALIKGESDELVSSDCMQCLCEGATGCNINLNCVRGEGYFCGPFEISWAYWQNAGSPLVKHGDPNNKGGFVACAKDVYCASETVRLYMKKYATLPDSDCNGDGVIDCTDFASIHRMGFDKCKKPDLRKTDFYKRFDACWKRIKGSRDEHSVPKVKN